MSEETKAAFESMRFYKFYPMPTPDTPDVSKVKVCVWAFAYAALQSLKFSCHPNSTLRSQLLGYLTIRSMFLEMKHVSVDGYSHHLIIFEFVKIDKC